MIFKEKVLANLLILLNSKVWCVCGNSKRLNLGREDRLLVKIPNLPDTSTATAIQTGPEKKGLFYIRFVRFFSIPILENPLLALRHPFLQNQLVKIKLSP